MSSFQAPIGLPPLSAIAAVSHDPAPLSTPEISGAPAFGAPTAVEYRDARIKDPVPKKLKGHTDNTNGNFSIMQMDLGGRESSMERDQLAKRSSASTELAAMRAYNSSYPVSSMKRFVRVPDDTGAWDPYYTTPTSQVSTQAPAQAPSQAPEVQRHMRPLSPAETKEEQARLLNLLRNIPPASVVDQICTAVAYFGGMQEGPPVNGVYGAFPKSELANGPGNMFIGWIAEIFPKLPNETTVAMQAMPRSNLSATNSATTRPESSGGVTDSETGPPAAMSAEDAAIVAQSPKLPNATTPAGKRPRGRPKGSKATKVRKDKGQKKDRVKPVKDSNEARYLDASIVHTNTQAQSAIPEGGGRTDEDSWVDVEDSLLDVAGGDGSGIFFSTNTNAASQQAPTRPLPDGNGDGPRMTELGKKRGRPKGSKNRPKPPNTDNTNGSAGSSVAVAPPPGVPGPAKLGRRPGPGRPKGSLTKKRHGSLVTTDNRGHADEYSTSQPGPYSAQNQATDSHQMGVLPDTSPVVPGGKRKRASKASKQIEMSLISSQAMPSPGQLQSPDLLNVASTPTSKKQKKSADARASARTGGANSIASQAASSSVMGMGGSSRGASSLMTTGADGNFNAGDFEVLSSHLSQDSPAVMAVHPGDREQSILSQHSHQRQHLQQQHLMAQKDLPESLPLHAGHIQGLASPVPQQSQANQQPQQPQRPQQQQQQQQQDSNQNQPSHQPQQHHSLPQVSNLGVSSTTSQHGVQTHMPGSISSSSLAAQQLPQPTRSAQSYYTQNRPNSNSPFNQSLSLPQLHNQQQQSQQQHQQQQQQQSKQQFVTQYPAQSTFNPQTQPQGFVTHPGQRSPQFGATGASRLRTTPDTYSTASASGPMPFGSPAYSQPRRTNATQGSPSMGGAYGTAGPSASHGLVHHGSPSFATSRQDTRSTAPHAQSVAGSAQGMQGFHGFDNQSLFDGINLDTAAGSGGLGLGGAATYNLSGNVQRTSSQPNTYGSVPSMPSFEANMGGNNIRDRFYSIRR